MQSHTLNCCEQNGVRLVCAGLNFVAAPKCQAIFVAFLSFLVCQTTATSFKYHYKEYLLWKFYDELSRHRQSEWKEWEDPFWLPRDELTRHGFFLSELIKSDVFWSRWHCIAFFSLKYSKGKFPLRFCSEKWRNTAEIQGKSNDSLLFT